MDWSEFIQTPSSDDDEADVSAAPVSEQPFDAPANHSNVLGDPETPSKRMRVMEDQESPAAPLPTAAHPDNENSIDGDDQKRLIREVLLETIYSQRETKYRQVYAVQCQRQQMQLARFQVNLIQPTELINRTLANWRQRVKATTQAFNERETRPKRERLRLEATIDYRFMINSFKKSNSIYAAAGTMLPLGEQQQKTLRQMEECLIPIRLEVEVEGMRFRDTLTWNIHEPFITPEVFAMILCEDFKLNASLFMPVIAQQIADQIEDFHRFMPSTMNQIELYSQLVTLDTDKMDQYMKRFFADDSGGEDETAFEQDLSSFEAELVGRLREMRHRYSHVSDFIKAATDFDAPGELRVPIRVCVIVNNVQLWDCVELDLLSTPLRSNIPEVIATSICSDLGLGGEYLTAVAHMIREQMWLYLKCLKIIGYPFDGSPILDEEFGQHFLPILHQQKQQQPTGTKKSPFSFGSGVRLPDDRDQWIPEYFPMSDGEIERLEKDRERESRRKRRGARGRRAAIVKPDEVDMFGFGLPKPASSAETQEESTGDRGEFGAITSAASQLIFDRSAIILPDMKEPLKTQRNQLNIHLRAKDTLRSSADPSGVALNVISTAAAATAVSSNYGSGALRERRAGRSGRAAAQAAMENIHAQQRDLPNDSPTNTPRPPPGVVQQPQLSAAEYMRQLQMQQLLLLRQQQQFQQQQRQPPPQ